MASAGRGTLRAFLGRLKLPWKYVLYRVGTTEGRVLGYILVHEDVFDSFFLDEEEGSVYAMGEFMGIGGE